jgi:hypothetical protein
MTNIVTGEKIQQIADLYLGDSGCFNYNPVISNQQDKHMHFDSLQEPYNNPRILFCYSHGISTFANKTQYFKNPFILITHNSDFNIKKEDPSVENILQCDKLVMWYAQNLCFHNDKLRFVPIGIANSMWPHGNLSLFNNPEFMNIRTDDNKKKNVYFNFNIHTNYNKRIQCYDSLKGKIPWLNDLSPNENLQRLREYKFAICPEGNGVDSHRIWESIYLKVVPIVVDSEFTQILVKNNIPMVVLNSWDDFDEGLALLDYSIYSFDNLPIYMDYFIKKIIV